MHYSFKVDPDQVKSHPAFIDASYANTSLMLILCDFSVNEKDTFTEFPKVNQGENLIKKYFNPILPNC